MTTDPERLRTRAWAAVARADMPLTPPQLGKLARLTAGGALTYLKTWTAGGELVCLPERTRNAPYLDHYATPALIARLGIDVTPRTAPDRRPTMTAPTTAPGPDRRPPMLTAALIYARRGWHVFPLAPGEKRPAVKDWETRATTDPNRITRCWSSVPPAGPYGIGIACGPSGLVVIDLDQPKPGHKMPPAPFNVPGIHDGGDVFTVICESVGVPVPWDTYAVTTASGGTHLYYTHAAAGDGWDGPALRNTAGTLGWLIDTRAAGGYVVAPPTTITGTTYTLAHTAPIAPLPAWLGKALAPRPIPAQKPVQVALSTVSRAGIDARRDAYLETALSRQSEAVRDAGPGGRNRALYLSAVALGQLVAGGELDEAGVTARLESAARTAGLNDVEIARTIRSGLRAGANRPRTLTQGVAA